MDYEYASKLAMEYGFNPSYKEIDIHRKDYWDPENSNPSLFPRRPMVVSVMGHVNHGKTTLLDALRGTQVAASEPGFITQDITAFNVDWKDDTGQHRLTMLDTPGHSAFFLMRDHGAAVSDFLLLIIAANEGISGQTFEVIIRAKEANIPMIVAINKIDVSTPEQIEKVYSQLHEHEVLDPRITRETNPYLHDGSQNEYEGEREYPAKGVIEISALNKQNLDVLLRALREKAELISDFLHPSDREKKLEATVIESLMWKDRKMLKVIVHCGTLVPGMWFLVQTHLGTVKALYDDLGNRVEKALPGNPVTIFGLKSESQLPDPGSTLFVLPREEAMELKEHRELYAEYKIREIRGDLFEQTEEELLSSGLEAEEEEVLGIEEGTAYEGIPRGPEDPYIVTPPVPAPTHKKKKPQMKKIFQTRDDSMKVVLKADTIGRLETLLELCNTLCNEGEIDVTIIARGVGKLTPPDIEHAVVEIEELKEPVVPIYCFGDCAPTGRTLTLLQERTKRFPGVLVYETYDNIYDLINRMKEHIQAKKEALKAKAEAREKRIQARRMQRLAKE
eukprot:TRINITY_DN10301_c0_g1_i1.p1 TRINITY_DN10301_c0_g1~~TRINITY_DN10301_c0_g1_i1.p1  ORF type:complete len:635 (-),score=146.74 TRINITY_DN10301_c0_g1_i1:84-1769(-)